MMTIEEMIEDAKIVVIWTGEQWMAGYFDPEDEYVAANIGAGMGTIDGHISHGTLTVADDLATVVRESYPKVVDYKMKMYPNE